MAGEDTMSSLNRRMQSSSAPCDGSSSVVSSTMSPGFVGCSMVNACTCVPPVCSYVVLYFNLGL